MWSAILKHNSKLQNTKGCAIETWCHTCGAADTTFGCCPTWLTLGCSCKHGRIWRYLSRRPYSVLRSWVRWTYAVKLVPSALHGMMLRSCIVDMLAFMHQADLVKSISVETEEVKSEVKEVKEVKPEQRDELLQKNLPVTLAHLTCIDWSFVLPHLCLKFLRLIGTSGTSSQVSLQLKSQTPNLRVSLQVVFSVCLFGLKGLWQI